MIENVNAGWERRLADAWASIDDYEGRDADFWALIEGLAAEAPSAARGDFERAGAFDSTGYSDRAVPLYQRALDAGLSGTHRRQATIQMASSLRNMGRRDETVRLLEAELKAGSDEFDDAIKCVLALALTDLGREREAVSLVVGALARHLPRYQRSMANYARLLLVEDVA